MAVARMTRLEIIGGAIGARWRMWIGITAGFVFLYYLALMAALVIKFGNLPNYAVAYDWPGNVWKIIVSTPSVYDMGPIIADEWLFEFGYMNHDYGHGISEWALDIIPLKVLLVAALGALIATHAAVVADRRRCGMGVRARETSVTGLGAMFVAFTSATMSWVVCCATPNWVVGLSMLGLGVSWSLWLEPIGPWMSALGFGFLCAGVFAAASPSARRGQDEQFGISDRQIHEQGVRT